MIEQGLKNVHNDTCYPAQLVIGQMIDALEHCELPLDKVALLITQTGGGCRASNYIYLLRKALNKCGYGDIPVISASFIKSEQSGRLLSAVDHAATGALRGAVRRFDYDLVQPVHPV